jgi:hypothetical protein
VVPGNRRAAHKPGAFRQVKREPGGGDGRGRGHHPPPIPGLFPIDEIAGGPPDHDDAGLPDAGFSGLGGDPLPQWAGAAHLAGRV